MSSHIGGGDPNTHELWEYYNGKSTFDEDDLSTFLGRLRKKMPSDKISEIKDQFEEELKEAVKVAQVVSAKLQNKYGHLSDQDILSKIKKYAKGYNLNSGQEHAIVQNIVEQRSVGTSNAKFSFRPVKFSRIGDMLGHPRQHSVGNVNISSEDQPYLNEIANLYVKNLALHQSLIEQTSRYRDCDFIAKRRQFDHNFNSANDAVMPLIVALFGPQIKALDMHFLIPNLAKIVKARSEGQQPKSLVDYDLIWNICRDNSTFSCTSDKSPMNDCLARVRIQTALWTTVFNMRNGALFHRENNDIRMYLQQCNQNVYMAPDMLINNDEHKMLERLFSAFAFKRVFMSKMPFQVPMAGFFGNSKINPFYSQQMHQVPNCEPVTFFTVRLPNIPIHSEDEESQVHLELKEQLSQQDFFMNPITQQIVPHHVKVVYAHGLFVVYINRFKTSFNIHKLQYMSQPFMFNQLPMIDQSNVISNRFPINCPLYMEIGDAKTPFRLRSYVSIPKIETTNADFISPDVGSVHYKPSNSEAWVIRSDAEEPFQYNVEKETDPQWNAEGTLDQTDRLTFLSKVLVYSDVTNEDNRSNSLLYGSFPQHYRR